MTEHFTKAQLLERGWTRTLIARWIPHVYTNLLGDHLTYPADLILQLEELPPVQIRMEETLSQRQISGQPALLNILPLDLDQIHSLGAGNGTDHTDGRQRPGLEQTHGQSPVAAQGLHTARSPSLFPPGDAPARRQTQHSNRSCTNSTTTEHRAK